MSSTPMMQQYLATKRAHPGTLLLFRMGDFYEMFHEDAETAARVLNLALTSRSKGDNAIPMAGFPHHALDNYLHKLLDAKIKVAICDQVEDPRQAKGLVKREVTRVVTPGTLTDESLLDAHASNYLLAVLPVRDRVGLAWVELSTGRFEATEVDADELDDELTRLEPAECLLPEDPSGRAPAMADGWAQAVTITTRPPWVFEPAQAQQVLNDHFGTTTLEGFGCAHLTCGVGAAGAIIDYLRETQRTSLAHITRLRPYWRGAHLVLDHVSQRGLEITRRLRDGSRKESLLWVLDRTRTAMGARMLHQWITAPLTDRDEIMLRQDAVAELVADNVLRQDLRELLAKAYDLERLATRVSCARATPRDLAFLGHTLSVLPKVKAKLTARQAGLLTRLESELELHDELRDRIAQTLVDDPPVNVRDGGIIRPGFHDDLDELREIAHGGRQWIAEFQAREVQRTGIPSLKVGYNKVFGYYIEVTHTHHAKVPDEYTRKQTLKNAERYITPELKQYETRVISADERSRDMEYELFTALRDEVAGHTARLHQTARVLATCDVLASLAQVAVDRNYCRPDVTDTRDLHIVDGRHPVLEQVMRAGEFVPNDVHMAADAEWLLIITGPNMAGKSTYIRQVALLVVMAQMGGFIPAKEASIGLVDRVFARIGSSDELARGQSTFMVEMVEGANILNGATDRSLIILDEIGRGTSTFDGLSLAWAITEYLQSHVKARTLFATHYHELTELGKLLPGLKNYNVAVREWQDRIIFLHKIIEGGADKSYGIHVARLAGIPQEVVERAKVILAQLEDEALDSADLPRLAHESAKRLRSARGLMARSLFANSDDPVLEAIRELDLSEMTPTEAHRLLEQYQRDLKGGSKRGRRRR